MPNKYSNEKESWLKSLLGYGPTYNQEAVQKHNEILRGRALDAAKNLAIGALLTGAGVRGGQELWKYLDSREADAYGGDQPVTLEIHDPERKSKSRKKKRTKKSEETPYNTPHDWPMAIPLYAAAGLGGAAVGYKGVEALVDMYQRYKLKRDLEEAEREFDEALQERYESSKTASDRYIDAQFEKSASTISSALGTGITLGGLLWLLSHGVTYNMFSKNDAEARKRMMLSRQRAMKQLTSPPPIKFKTIGKDEDEDDKKDSSKGKKSAAAGAESQMGQLNELFGAVHNDEKELGETSDAMVDVAKQVAQDPKGLAPVTQGILGDENVARGIRKGIGEAAFSAGQGVFGGNA